MPVALREGTKGHRAYVRGAWLVAAAVLVYPLVAAELGLSFGSVDVPARIGQLNTAIAISVAILGLDLVTGYSGQLALGQSAFVGLGAYTTVILVADHHWSFYAALPATVAVCFVGGLLVGIPATRVKGVYLAIVTLVLASVFPSIVRRFDWLTGGSNGKGPPRSQGHLRPPSWMPFADAGRLAGPLWVYCLSLAVATGTFAVARNLVRSRPGRALITMRDHEPAAVALGVDVGLYKALAFSASAVYGGLAGFLLMLNRPFASDVLFDPQMSIFLLAGLVIGGTGTLSGAVPGALAYVFVPYFMTTWAYDQSGLAPGVRQLTKPLFVLLRPAGGEAAGIFFGAALVVLMFVLPGGFVAGLRRLRARIVTVVPDPSWLAAADRRGPRLAEVAPASTAPDVAFHAAPPGGPVVLVPIVAPVSAAGRSTVAAENTVAGVEVRIVAVEGATGDGLAADDPDAMWRR